MKSAIGILIGLLVASPPALRGAEPDFKSKYLAVSLAPREPAFSRFTVDSLGQGKLEQNPVLPSSNVVSGLQLEKDLSYKLNGQPVWRATLGEKSIALRCDYIAGVELPPFVLVFNQKANHPTLLGRMQPGQRQMELPCVLHLPDMGTLRITGNARGAKLDYDARRLIKPPFVHIAFPPATAGQPHVEYRMEVTAIYPKLSGIEEDSRYDGFRRDWLNIFQVNPRVQMLANNASSDPCSFTLFEYSDLAMHTPPLAEGLTCLDLVRMTLDRYIAGAKGYGQVGYACTPSDADLMPWKTPWTSLDTLPSFLISACNYVNGSNDVAWAQANYARLAAWGREMFAADKDGNGLIEYPGTGNHGDRPKRDRRPSNWWDTINFGHEDAFANALAYRAAMMFADLAGKLGHADDATFFTEKAAKLRDAYAPTFLNPATGLLAGWKSRDGQLHDYSFTFVQGMAVTFGLLDDKTANGVMDRVQAKMAQVGYTNFALGLPGNLVPIPKGEYVHENNPPEVTGEPRLDDGSDGFQFYENGGATGCWAYYTLKALYQLGRVEESRRMFYPMLAGYARGEFQGFGPNGRSRDWRDWRDWQGGCHGYEGLLVDNYHALLAVLDDVKAPRPVAAKPALWAMYYAWYETATGPHRKWNVWTDDKTTNPNPKRKSKAQPLVGYYDSDDPEVVRWHVRLAKAAGIEAFLVSWWGGANISGLAFEKTILPVAAEEKFKVAMCSELAQFHQEVKVLAQQMSDVLRRTKDSPAYLHIDGKPVAYLYQVPFAPEADAGDVHRTLSQRGGRGGHRVLDHGQGHQPGQPRTEFPCRVAEDSRDPDVRFLRHLQHQADLAIRRARAALRPAGRPGSRRRQESVPSCSSGA